MTLLHILIEVVLQGKRRQQVPFIRAQVLEGLRFAAHIMAKQG